MRSLTAAHGHAAARRVGYGLFLVLLALIYVATSAAHLERHRTDYYRWAMQSDLPLSWDGGLSNGALVWDNVSGQCHDFVQDDVDPQIVHDKYYYDGKYGVLAETLFYHYGIVYDSSETWHLNVNVSPGASSVDLWSIAAHENGHTLAIEHLSPPNTMQEVIDTQTLYGTTHFRSLEGGDVAAIRSLYGC